jgi:hypothetical protein
VSYKGDQILLLTEYMGGGDLYQAILSKKVSWHNRCTDGLVADLPSSPNCHQQKKPQLLTPGFGKIEIDKDGHLEHTLVVTAVCPYTYLHLFITAQPDIGL